MCNLLSSMPEVDAFLGTGAINQIVDAVEARLPAKGVKLAPATGLGMATATASSCGCGDDGCDPNKCDCHFRGPRFGSQGRRPQASQRIRSLT